MTGREGGRGGKRERGKRVCGPEGRKEVRMREGEKKSVVFAKTSDAGAMHRVEMRVREGRKGGREGGREGSMGTAYPKVTQSIFKCR